MVKPVVVMVELKFSTNKFAPKKIATKKFATNKYPNKIFATNICAPKKFATKKFAPKKFATKKFATKKAHHLAQESRPDPFAPPLFHVHNTRVCVISASPTEASQAPKSGKMIV
uniref:Uncharacterized protein n=1 Tax=Anopheles merus TaxID=30066 RepID=A0A182V9F9_ANOME